MIRSADIVDSHLIREWMLAYSRGVASCTGWLRPTQKLHAACVTASNVFHVKHQSSLLSGGECVSRSDRLATVDCAATDLCAKSCALVPTGFGRAATQILGECGAPPGAPCQRWRQVALRLRAGVTWGTVSRETSRPSHSNPRLHALAQHLARLELARDYPGPPRLGPNGDGHPGTAFAQDHPAHG